MLIRAFLAGLCVWVATAALLQPGLAQLVPFLVVLTALSAVALLSLGTRTAIVRILHSVRVQWLRSLGVPATGLSGSVPTLVLLAQPRR